MEFKRRKLVFKLDGKEYSCSYPSVRQLDEYTEASSAAKPGEELKVLISFLGKLGLNEDLCWSLERDHLEKIVEEVAGTKKK